MKYNLDGVTYLVEIVRKNNKNIYVRVKEKDIIYVTASYFTTKRQIIRLLDNNQDFLRKALAKRKKEKEQESQIHYLGRKYDLIISNLFNDVEMNENKIYANSEKDFQKWYRGEMIKIFEQRYQYCYQMFKEKIPLYILKFRTMKTRWGVCNRKSKTITLNTRLLEYDISCLDYVIIHELSHLLEFNHSTNFWKIVEKYCPNYKQIRKILKD